MAFSLLSLALAFCLACFAPALVDAVDCELREFPSQDLAACVAKRNCTAPCAAGYYAGCAGYLHGWESQVACVLDIGADTDSPVAVVAAVLSRAPGDPDACRGWCTDVYLGAVPTIIATCFEGCANARVAVAERIERENVDPSPLESPSVIAGIAIGFIAVILLCVLVVKPKCDMYVLRRRAYRKAEERRVDRERARGRAAEEGSRTLAGDDAGSGGGGLAGGGGGGGGGGADKLSGKLAGKRSGLFTMRIKKKHGGEAKKHRKKQKRQHRGEQQAQVDMTLAGYFSGRVTAEKNQVMFRDGTLTELEPGMKTPRRLLDLEVRNNIDRGAPSPALP